MQKRRRREYRQIRKLQFKRPQPGFSLYEGRTRGKRVKYTFSDDEDDFLTDSTTRRSTRNRGSETAPEQSGPVVTASGRQVRAPSRLNAEGANGDSSTREPSQEFDVDMNDDADAVRPGRRSLRHPPAKHQDGWQSKGRPKMRGFDNWLPSDEEDEGTEPDFGDDEEEDEHVPYETDDDDEEFEDEAMDEDDEELAGQSVRKSFPVTLRIRAVLGDDGKYHKVPSSPRPRQPSPAADPLPRDEITVSVQAPPANDAMTPPPTLASSTATQASTATPVSTTTTAPNSLADAQQQQQQQSMTPRPSKETTPELAPTTTMPSASLPGEGLLCEPPPAPKLPATPPHAVSGTAAAPTSLAFRGSPEKVQPPPPLPPQVL